jgi:hypothetical protein
VRLLRSRPTVRPYLKPVRLFSHKAAQHKCGAPATYHALVWVESLGQFRCTGCGRIVGR